MTPTEVKQAADELVEMFTKIIWESGNTVSKPMIIDVCIAHCKLVIEVLELSTPGTYTNYLFKKNRLILSELEGRVK
jgi:hypothetical protein